MRFSANACVRICGGGKPHGSRMGYHGNILLKTNGGAGVAEIEDLI